MSKVRVAILGCGGYSGAHAGRLKHHSDVEIVGLCDVSESIVEGYIAKHLEGEPRPAVFTDAGAMYAATNPDAVFIVTPHTLHYAHASQALKAGCHVFLEKPMVTRAEDAHALASEAERAGKIVVVGYNTPCTPEFLYLRDEIIRPKALGRLELVTGYISQNWLRGTMGTWRQKPELSGGGQAYDSGAHMLNSVCWTVEDDIEQVHAFVDNVGSPVDINSTINVRFKSGVMAALTVGGNCPTHGTHLVYLFDGGKVEVDGWSGHWINIYRGRDRVKYPPITGEAQTPDDNFIDAILGRAEPRTSPRNGIIHTELMDAIYESARTGMPASPRRMSV